MTFCRALCVVAFILSTTRAQDECYEICDSKERNTKEVGECLQRKIDDGGQGSSVQDAMLEIYENVVQSRIKPGGVEGEDSILIGLNAAKAGTTAVNSEGLYYCTLDADSGADAFYWVLNCSVLKQGLSGDESLCVGLTLEEQDMPRIGYVVDETLLGDDKFHRYVFNSSTAISTETQPIEANGFSCSGRPWFTSTKCIDPLATTCPTDFQGSSGRGAFQHYGQVENATVVAQDVREWQLAPCLDSNVTSQATKRITCALCFILMSAVHVLVAYC